jgi:hypothetical protein
MGEAELKKWRSNREKSLRALPGHAAFLLLVALALWAAHRWLHLPPWLAVALVLLSAAGLIGDIVNVVYLGRRLAASRAEDT